MKRKFNDGQPYHGSEIVEQGKLTGATTTDYFYFFCPRCPDQQMLRVLEYGEHGPESKEEFDKQAKEYNEKTKGKKLKYGFALVFKIYCQKCELTDFVKISNIGWQGGSFSDIPYR